METRLQLLMRDGALTICFRPRLEGEQYDDLLKVADDCNSREELADAVRRLAARWRREVMIDDD